MNFWKALQKAVTAMAAYLSLDLQDVLDRNNSKNFERTFEILRFQRQFSRKINKFPFLRQYLRDGLDLIIGKDFLFSSILF